MQPTYPPFKNLSNSPTNVSEHQEGHSISQSAPFSTLIWTGKGPSEMFQIASSPSSQLQHQIINYSPTLRKPNPKRYWECKPYPPTAPPISRASYCNKVSHGRTDQHQPHATIVHLHSCYPVHPSINWLFRGPTVIDTETN